MFNHRDITQNDQMIITIQKFRKEKRHDKQFISIRAEQINDALNGKESEIIEIVKNTYLFHNEGKTALPHSIFLRFPNDERNRIIGLPHI